MSKYNTFLTLFIVSAISFIFFIVFYLQGIFSFIGHAQENQDPLEIFSTIFSPAVIISIVTAVVTSLARSILGIVYVAKNKIVSDGEKAIWIVGFILMSFITSIVFLIMARGKKFVE